MTCDKSLTDSLKKPLILKRHWIVFFAVCSSFIMCFLRYNLSVAIVAILDDSELIPNMNGTIQTRKKYQFTEFEVGQLLASYFYGYTVSQFPAARLSEIFGAKWILGLGIFLSGILSFASPFMLDLGSIPMIITRIIIGLLHGTVLSCSYTLFNEWLPDDKRSNAITLINAGFELGGMCAFYFTGIISSSYLGWRYSFYLFSLTAFIWFIPFCFLVSSRPEDAKLSNYEKNLIEQERKVKYKNQLSLISSNSNLIKILPKLDYKKVLTSPVVWSSCIAKASCAFCYIILMTEMPVYLHDVYNIPLDQEGTFTAFTSAGIMISKFLCFRLSPFVLNLKKFSLTTKRKFFQTIAMLTPAICLLIIILKNDNKELVIFLLVMSMFGNGFVCLGDAPMTAEFSKDLSGSIFGFTNTFACIAAIVGPLFCGFILESYPNNLILAWNIIFIITLIFFIIGLIVFLLFAKAETVSWADSKFITIDELNQTKKQIPI